MIWLILGIVAGALVLWFAHRKDTQAVLVQIALGCVFAGAIGNVFDRCVYQYVRDFIDVCYWPGRHWPAFNVADVAVSCGAALAMLASWRKRPYGSPTSG